MSLDQFIYTKTILIDDAGWGDLILGVVIGALKLPDRRYMERRIPVTSFQSPNFENKAYLDDARRIGKEIVEAMQPDKQTCFKVCSGYILSGIRGFLEEQGFHVEKTVITGELQERVEKSFIEWCIEVGVPRDKLESNRRFYPILDWVADKIELRERLVKTGWKSWQNKWRQEAQKLHLQKIGQLQRTM
ncbi:MAG: hypothetical protein QXI71_06115 [Candidatus Bathyarchaeia archaeon]|nr:hypothetical protein [Candidatus Bathyarchaeota archaeon]